MTTIQEISVPQTANFKLSSEITGVPIPTIKSRFASGELQGYTFGPGGREIRFFVADLLAMFVPVGEKPRSDITAQARAASLETRRNAADRD